jgi:RNA polymerase sigma factor (sigma-70 family)
MKLIDQLSSTLLPPSTDQKLEAILQQLATGDNHELSHLYELTQVSLYSYLLAILRHPNNTADVQQDVYLMIIEKAHLYVPMGKPMAWIFTIARNLAYQYQAKNSSSGLTPEDWMSLSHDTLSVEEVLTLQLAMTKLTEEERQIVLLHTISGYRHREIAQTLGIPLATVLSKYHRALKKLKQLLKEDFT